LPSEQTAGLPLQRIAHHCAPPALSVAVVPEAAHGQRVRQLHLVTGELGASRTGCEPPPTCLAIKPHARATSSVSAAASCPGSGCILSSQPSGRSCCVLLTRSRSAGTAVRLLWAEGGDSAGRHTRLGAGSVAGRRLGAGLRALRRRKAVDALRCQGVHACVTAVNVWGLAHLLRCSAWARVCL